MEQFSLTRCHFHLAVDRNVVLVDQFVVILDDGHVQERITESQHHTIVTSSKVLHVDRRWSLNKRHLPNKIFIMSIQLLIRRKDGTSAATIHGPQRFSRYISSRRHLILFYRIQHQ